MQHTTVVLKIDLDIVSLDTRYINGKAELLRVLGHFVARTGVKQIIVLEGCQCGDAEDWVGTAEEVIIKASKWAVVPERETHFIALLLFGLMVYLKSRYMNTSCL
jgi:hypothetical protein